MERGEHGWQGFTRILYFFSVNPQNLRYLRSNFARKNNKQLLLKKIWEWNAENTDDTDLHGFYIFICENQQYLRHSRSIFANKK